MTAPISEMTATLHEDETFMSTATQGINIGPPDEGQLLSELEPARMPGWLPITIGAQRQMIKKLAYRENQAWKKEMEQVVKTLLPAFDRLKESGQVQGGSAEDLERVIHEALVMVDGAIDGALNLLIHYGKLDREKTETTIFDDEIIENFLEIVKVAVPLDQLSRLLETMGRGRRG